jgi:hypothetical protein
MALIQIKYCRECATTEPHTNGVCNRCRDREERRRIALWNCQTDEDKMQDLRRRVEALEKGPTKW